MVGIDQTRGEPLTRDLKPDVYLARSGPVYDDLVREAAGPIFRSLCAIWTEMGLDPDNPFRGWLRPGSCALIKPNWVMDVNLSGGGIECLVTHSTLLFYMIRWCAQAMQGHGRIIVGDCPIQGCDFSALLRHTRMQEVVDAVARAYPDLRLDVEDWRLTVLRRAGGPCRRPVYTDQTLRGSPVEVAEHYTVLDAGRESFLEEISDCSNRFRVTMYQPSLLQAHHRPGVHQYLIRNDVLDADLLINLAKLKTHEKAGLTGAMKNLVAQTGTRNICHTI